MSLPCPQQHVGLCSGGVGSSSRVQDAPWGCRVLARPGQDLRWGYVCPPNRRSLLGVLPPSGWADPFRAPCWGALRVLGSHAGTKHVPTPPLGRGTGLGAPPAPISPGSVRRDTRGSESRRRAAISGGAGPMLSARRGCHGESPAGQRGLILSRVELAASRVPEPRFRAAAGPGQWGVVQGLVEESGSTFHEVQGCSRSGK